MPHPSPTDTSGAAARVRQIAPPSSVRALSALSRIDYADAFLVDVDAVPERTAEQWARLMLEGAPSPMRRSLLAGWRSLGLRLGSTESPAHVLGWELRRTTPELALLGAPGRLGLSGELVLQRRADTLLFATLVRQEHAAARALWAAVEPTHVQVVRRLLRRL